MNWIRYSAVAIVLLVLADFADAQERCETPNKTQGQCIEISRCPAVYALQNSPDRNVENSMFLRNSQCGATGRTSKVCCEDDLDAVFDAKRCGLPAVEEKIFGGTEAAIDQYPWLALMEYRKPNGEIRLHCGAVLIGPKYALTAGHCIKWDISKIGVPVNVRLGEYDIANLGPDCKTAPGGGLDCSDGHVSIPIEEIIAHPDYNSNSTLKRDDIALVRLQTPAPYTDFIRHICMPTVDVTRNLQSNGLNFSVAGWGSTEKKQRGSNHKLFVVVPFKAQQQCQASYVDKLTIQLWDKQLCAGGVKGEDACKGDSGGPLMYLNKENRHEVAGIVSFGPIPCGRPGVPGVYSKVTEYTDWIRSVVRH